MIDIKISWNRWINRCLRFQSALYDYLKIIFYTRKYFEGSIEKYLIEYVKWFEAENVKRDNE